MHVLQLYDMRALRPLYMYHVRQDSCSLSIEAGVLGSQVPQGSREVWGPRIPNWKWKILVAARWLLVVSCRVSIASCWLVGLITVLFLVAVEQKPFEQ